MGTPSDLIIFDWKIHLYSLFFATGAFLAYFLARKFAQSQKFDEKKFDGAVLMVFVTGLIGARLFFVLGHWTDYFRFNLGEVWQFWQGGLAFYGGVLGGAVGALAAAKFYQINFWRLLDFLAVGLPVGQAVGRMGNFFNQEAFGSPTTLPWGIYISPDNRPPGLASFSHFHPTYFYEAAGLLIIFAILWKIRRRSLAAGVIFAVYAVLSGGLRAIVEILRTDALLVNNLKISQLAAILLMFTGLILLGKDRKFKVSA